MQGYCGSLSKLLVTLHLMAFQHSSLDQLTPGRKPEINHGDEQFRAVGLYRDLFRTSSRCHFQVCSVTIFLPICPSTYPHIFSVWARLLWSSD